MVLISEFCLILINILVAFCHWVKTIPNLNKYSNACEKSAKIGYNYLKQKLPNLLFKLLPILNEQSYNLVKRTNVLTKNDKVWTWN